MQSEKTIRNAIKDIQEIINKEVYNGLQSEEGKQIWLDRLNVLIWVLEESEIKYKEENK